MCLFNKKYFTGFLNHSIVTFFSLILIFLCGPVPAMPGQDSAQDDDDDEDVIMLSPFEVSSPGTTGYMATDTLAGTRVNTSLRDIGTAISVVTSDFLSDLGGMGATVGGAQTIAYFRGAVDAEQIPHPNTLTPEGLFSEHDLPLIHQKQTTELLGINCEAMPITIPELANARYLAQLGFSSGLNAATWSRQPLNLIAVVDKSGSMNGAPLQLVKESLQAILKQLHPGDQLGIVLYGNISHVHCAPLPVTDENRPLLENNIKTIVSAGSTNMEEGLKVGFNLAENSGKSFRGLTRVMLFTDERPNVGDTSAEGFMGLARHYSDLGVGMTTVGVGTQYGAELAEKISSVRGGNLYFFPDREDMKRVFEEDFDTMITELAYELTVDIEPAPGFHLTGVYGIPGEMLKWVDGRNIRFQVETIFLSKRKGAIYFTLGEDQTSHLPLKMKQKNTPLLANVRLEYVDAASGKSVSDKMEVAECRDKTLSPGLNRGALLVEEYVVMTRAGQEHYFNNDQEKAYQLVRDFHTKISLNSDPELDIERDLVGKLHQTLAHLSGHGGESPSGNPVAALSAGQKRLLGSWICNEIRKRDEMGHFIANFLPDGRVMIAEVDEYDGSVDAPDEYFYSLRRNRLRIFDDEARQIESETFKVSWKKNKLVLKSLEKPHSLYYLEQYEPEESFAQVELDPLTGLPKRSS